MKRLFSSLAALMALTFAIQAQDQTRQQDRDRDQDQTYDQIQKRDRIHQEDHLLYRDGKMYHVRNGILTEMTTRYQLKNGGLVHPDGSYQLVNQDRLQLRNGQCLDMDGNRYLNQKKFNKRKMLTVKQLERERNRTINKPGRQNQQNKARNNGGRRGNN